MKYVDFEEVMSSQRMNRYRASCANDTRKAMTLYRYNLKLSQELFTLISCFEVGLRNKIDSHFSNNLGPHWLRTGASVGGFFDNRFCHLTATNINNAINNLGANYSEHKVVAELGFGFWRFMFAANQFRATGRTLLQILPNKPRSTRQIQYNNIYVFNELASVNTIRNRIAHHEPICFRLGTSIIDTTYARNRYHRTINMFNWMNINSAELLFGLDHIVNMCDKIDNL